MLRRKSLWYGILAALAVTAFAVNTAQAQKGRARTVSGPPFLELSASPTTLRACAGSTALVQLNARASSQSGNPIRYKWATDGGRLIGDGPNPSWDLSGMQPGVYRATLEVDSSTRDDENCAAFSAVAVVVSDCPPVQPLCPNVSISCPNSVALDQPITFTANVSGGTGLLPSYNWSLNAGSIIEGQGTRSIRVDTTGLAGQTVTATLDVRVNGLSCPASCAVQIPLPRAECRKFDEFPKIPRNDEKARLDNFAIDLQNTPGSTAYIIVYPGRGTGPGEAEQHTNRIVDYLISYRGIDARRVIKLIGPRRPDLMVELWTCPPGVRPSGLLQ